MSLAFTKRINKEIKNYSQSNFCFPNLILQPNKDDFSIWYFLIYDLKDTDYENGIYLGKVILPPKYPFKAPDFIFLTETGRFEINRKICTTFSAFHNDQFSPSWNVASMCNGLISFITDPDDTEEAVGIGRIITSKEEKRKIAKESRNVIKENEIFKTYFSKYSNLIFGEENNKNIKEV